MPDSIHPAWRAYQRWRRTLWAMLLGFVPATLLFARVAWAFSWSETVVFTFAFLWGILTFLCLTPRSSFRCPRCGELFHAWIVKGAFQLRFNQFNVWARKCQHCGLRRYANP